MEEERNHGKQSKNFRRRIGQPDAGCTQGQRQQPDRHQRTRKAFGESNGQGRGALVQPGEMKVVIPLTR